MTKKKKVNPEPAQPGSGPGATGKEENGDHLDHYLQAVLNEDKYFLALPLIFRIINPLEIFPLPDTPAFIVGVTNFSGEIIPMVDMKKMLNLPDLVENTGKKFILCKYEDMKVGFIVDNVIDSHRIDTVKIKTDTTRVLENDFISGEYIYKKEVIGIIDIVKFIDTHKAAQ